MWRTQYVQSIRHRFASRETSKAMTSSRLMHTTTREQRHEQAWNRMMVAATGAAALAMTMTEKETHAEQNMVFRRMSGVYQVDQVLGEGGFAQVNLGRHKRSDTSVAIKKMSKRRTTEDQFRREVSILKQVGGKHNIIALRDAFETKHEWVIVTEVAEGGELFEHLVAFGTYSEEDAISMALEAFLALQFLHSNGIVHADIKPENIVLPSKTDKTKIRLVDFGLAFRQGSSQKPAFADGSGTVAYSAPEVLQKKECGTPLDIWSLGIVLYILIAGIHPFDPDNDNTDSEVAKLAIEGKFNFSARGFRRTSPQLRDLIKRMLEVDPKKRITAAEALQHPWLAKAAKERKGTCVSRKQSNLEEAKSRLLGSMAAFVISAAGKEGNEEDEKATTSWFNTFDGEESKDAFDQAIDMLDPSRKGYIDKKDLKNALELLGLQISDTEVHELLLAAINDPFSNDHHIQYSDVASIVSGLDCKKFSQNDCIFTQGDRAQGVYLVLDGEVELSIADEASQQNGNIVISKLRSGKMFGHEGVDTPDGEKRSCTAKCLSPTCRVMKLGDADIKYITDEFQYIEKQVKHEYRAHIREAVSTYLAQCSAEAKREVTRASGDVICEQGTKMDKLYLIEKGEVQVTKKLKNGNQVVVETLGAGDFFPLGVCEGKELRDVTVKCKSNDVKLTEIEGPRLRQSMTESAAFFSHSMKQEIERRREERRLRALRVLTRAMSQGNNTSRKG